MNSLPRKLFENEGAIFRGYHRHTPLEVWRRQTQSWELYTGYVPKPYEWGDDISEQDAARFMTPRT